MATSVHVLERVAASGWSHLSPPRRGAALRSHGTWRGCRSGIAFLLALAMVGCAAHAPARRRADGLRERPAPGSLGAARPPVRTARARPPAAPLWRPPAALRPDDGPLTAKISADTPPSRAAALRLTEQARGLLAGGETARAIELLERAIAIEARVPYPYYFLAEAYYRAGRPGPAHSFLDRAEQTLAREPYWLGEVRTLRGLVSEGEGRLTEARSAYRRALAVWPSNERAAAGLARVADTSEGAP